MRKWYWFGGLTTLAVMAFLLVGTSSSYAQTQSKYLPTLTLVKSLSTNGPADVTQQDTIYVAQAGPGEKRYLLIPIFVKNVLDSIANPFTGLDAEPLYSFRFKLQYNKTLLHAIGVQKRGVLPSDTTVAAKNFNLSFDVDDDTTFRAQTIGIGSPDGERILVTGASATPLPLPLVANPGPPSGDPRFHSPNDRDTAVLLYVLFEVRGTAQLSGNGVGNRDQIIISNDTLEWNNYRTTSTLNPFVQQSMINRRFNQDPRAQAGIAPTPIFPITYPNNYGSAVVVVTEQPRIELFPPGQVILTNPSNPSDYELVLPLQTQFGNANLIYRNLLLRNNVQGTFLRNVTIETDQPWLRVDMNSPLVQPGVGQGGTPPNDRGMFVPRYRIRRSTSMLLRTRRFCRTRLQTAIRLQVSISGI